MTLYPDLKRVEEVKRFLKTRAHVSFSASLEDMEMLSESFREKSEEMEVRARLKRGDFAAWFYGTCTAEWMGVSAKAAHGRCSFSSFKMFEMSAEYEGLRESALRLLATKLAAIERTLRDQIPVSATTNGVDMAEASRNFMALLEI